MQPRVKCLAGHNAVENSIRDPAAGVKLSSVLPAFMVSKE